MDHILRMLYKSQPANDGMEILKEEIGIPAIFGPNGLKLRIDRKGCLKGEVRVVIFTNDDNQITDNDNSHIKENSNEIRSTSIHKQS